LGKNWGEFPACFDLTKIFKLLLYNKGAQLWTECHKAHLIFTKILLFNLALAQLCLFGESLRHSLNKKNIHVFYEPASGDENNERDFFCLQSK
jgi:hypothetical protein